MPLSNASVELIDTENPPQERRQLHEGITSIRAFFNTLNAVLGFGILATPFALSQGGWLSIIILFMAAFVCCYTGLLLQRCFNANPIIKTYPEIAEQAFGMKTKVLVSIFLYLELYLVAVELIILEGDNLAKLFPNGLHTLFGSRISVKQGFIIITALIILPTTWMRSLGLLAYISVGGILSSTIVVLSVLWLGIFGGVGFHERGKLFDIKHMPISMSLFIFCYGGHPVFPTLSSSMRHKHDFSKVLVLTFTMSTIAYGSMAVFGYLMYGDRLESQITLNLPNAKICSQIAIYATLIIPLTKYALILNPISVAIEERFKLHRQDRYARLVSVLVRTLLVISTAIVALIVPLFAYVMAFIGSFLIVILGILLPCLIYLKLNWLGVINLENMIVLVIIAVGFLVGAIGTYNALRDIIKNV